MKRFVKYFIPPILICIFAVSILQYFHTQNITIKGSNCPPQILLFNCHYGAGHKMATESIVESLPDCEIRVVDIYDEPLAPLDPIGSWIPGLRTEHIYNDLIKKEQNQILNLAGKITPKIVALREKKIQELLKQFIAKDKPDLVISCVPLLNADLLSVTNELKIPFLVITTDIDISAFCSGFGKDFEENRSHFCMTVPYDKKEWNQLFGSYFPTALQASFQYSFGYPTRRAFSETPRPEVLNQLRADYEIKEDEAVILVMMGGNAGHAAKTYAHLLMQLDDEALNQIVGQDKKIHLISLCGDVSVAQNRTFMDSLNEMKPLNNRVRIHGSPGTPKIAELVSLPELFVVISKPGGSTVNEMIKKRVPMIYHTKKHPLDWEKGNMEYGEFRGLGKRFNPKMSNLNDFVQLLSESFALRNAFLSGEVAVEEAELDFTSNLREKVRNMLREDS